MNNNTHLIITSINAPNKALIDYAEGAKKHGVQYTVVGDRKSPADFKIDNCNFLSIDDQYKIGSELSEILPENHYARKNIGYINAIKAGAEIIVETDDDNLPYESFWNDREKTIKARTIENQGWLNVYKYFSEVNISPRRFHLDLLAQPLPKLEEFSVTSADCPIQQGLANDNPDVDAIYRLILPLPIKFDDNEDLAFGKGTICPFNSQNTTWFKEAFALLYLPSYCSFRMTDIWRSFIAQRIGWVYGWNLLFHKPTVYQERNEHNLMKDFEDEVPGYLTNQKIMDVLMETELSIKPEDIGKNLLKCYSALVTEDIFPEKELELVKRWNKDLGLEF